MISLGRQTRRLELPDRLEKRFAGGGFTARLDDIRRRPPPPAAVAPTRFDSGAVLP